jgi:urate oxidase
MNSAHPAAAPEPPPAARPVLLGPNQYGKAETRVVRVVREGRTHHIKDLNVSVALSGDMAEVHYSGSNAHVLPTDTTKNTVYAFARRYGIDSAEGFGIDLARHFVTSQEPIQRARIRIEEYAWDRIGPPGDAGEGGAADATGRDGTGRDATATATDATGRGGHSFVRAGRETRTAQITYDGARWEVLTGLKDLTVLNSTDSEFWGYAKDEYTTLQEAYDRILATEVTGVWRHGWTDDTRPMPDWEESYAATRRHILDAFAQTYSLSLQQTLYQMGSRVLGGRPELDEIRFSLPNKHHFLVDLEPFGLPNDPAEGAAVYFAADRPYGLIEATVLREGAQALIPADLTNLP